MRRKRARDSGKARVGFEFLNQSERITVSWMGGACDSLSLSRSQKIRGVTKYGVRTARAVRQFKSWAKRTPACAAIVLLVCTVETGRFLATKHGVLQSDRTNAMSSVVLIVFKQSYNTVINTNQKIFF